MTAYNQKYTYNLSLFERPSAVTYYMLGVFLTDGNVHKSLNNCNIYSKDGEWLQSLATTICPTLKITNRKDRNCFYFNVCNQAIVSWLVSQNCVPNKSLTVKMPPNIPKKYISHFLRGVIDGDGYVSCYQRKRDKDSNNQRFILDIGITTASKVFADSLLSLFCELGVRAKIRSRKKAKAHHNPLYDVRCNASEALKLCQIIYRDKNLFLDRKYKAFTTYIDRRAVYEKLSKTRGINNVSGDRYGDPTKLIDLISAHGYQYVADMFGVTQSAVIQKLQRLGLQKPKA